MSMRRRLAAASCIGALLLSMSSASAATVDIDVRSNFFEPAVVHLDAGDDVRWTIRSGAHDVTTYAGTMSFGSPLMTPSDDPFVQTYAGGEVLYRCTPHSSVAPSGICTGMCGVLSDRTAAPAAPIVESPSPNGVVPGGDVLFAGTAEPWSVVRLFEGGTPLGEALSGGEGDWSLTRAMPGGTHTVAVRADGADGSVGAAATVTFTVEGAPDAVPPDVHITSGPLTVGAGEAAVFGEAFDNVGVARVIVYATDRSGTRLAQTVASCPACGARQVLWDAVLELPPGAALVYAMAEDSSGNRSAPAGPVHALVLPR